jgi:hypothetical protein
MGVGAEKQAPCGWFEFVPVSFGKDDGRGGKFEIVQMMARFPDKHVEQIVLDYPWHYRTASDDPWAPENVRNPRFDNGIAVQLPPLDRRPLEPPLVQYLIKVTAPDGNTKLPACPVEK